MFALKATLIVHLLNLVTREWRPMMHPPAQQPSLLQSGVNINDKKHAMRSQMMRILTKVAMMLLKLARKIFGIFSDLRSSKRNRRETCVDVRDLSRLAVHSL